MAHPVRKDKGALCVGLDDLSESSVVIVVSSEDERSDSIPSLDMLDVRADLKDDSA